MKQKRRKRRKFLLTPEERKQYQKEWRDDNRPHLRQYAKNYYGAHKPELVTAGKVAHLRLSYGMTLEDFEALWASQSGQCAICKDTLVRGRFTHIDHDHTTDLIRGLLCQDCNHLVGKAKDRIDILQSAISYLSYHKGREKVVAPVIEILERHYIPEPNSGCWLWLGSCAYGWGKLKHDGENVYAHRLMYETVNGPVPEGKELNHLCGIRSCVNPVHLEIRDRRIVQRDASGRIIKTHCRNGHALTPDNIARGGRCKICYVNQYTEYNAKHTKRA